MSPHIAVLGGGPAGSIAAAKLAASGMRVTLLDEKLAWEKPCGGGLTYKAYSQYPFLLENETPKQSISQAVLSSPQVGSASLKLGRPLLIYSRYELNRMLLDRAEAAGARIEKARVTGLERRNVGWRLRTPAGALESDFCIVATGARNGLTHVGTEWSAGNTMAAMGYYIPGQLDRVEIQFFQKFAGYIWLFPRKDHISAGICAKGVSSRDLRQQLEKYLAERSISVIGAKFYAHVIPSLEKPEWRTNRVAGDGWMATGDAAGLVDPVTGEGLYYAIRSGDLAAESLLETSLPAAAGAYRDRLQAEFLDEMELASRLAKRLYMGKFLYGDVPGRMIQFLRRSPTFCEVVQDLFAGTQGYLDLKARLLRSLSGTAREVLVPGYFRSAIPAPRA